MAAGVWQPRICPASFTCKVLQLFHDDIRCLPTGTDSRHANSRVAVRRIRLRLRRYGTTTSPVSRERTITPLMRNALFEQLAKRPDMFRYEMISFLNERFGLEVSPTTMSKDRELVALQNLVDSFLGFLSLPTPTLSV